MKNTLWFLLVFLTASYSVADLSCSFGTYVGGIPSLNCDGKSGLVASGQQIKGYKVTVIDKQTMKETVVLSSTRSMTISNASKEIWTDEFRKKYPTDSFDIQTVASVPDNTTFYLDSDLKQKGFTPNTLKNSETKVSCEYVLKPDIIQVGCATKKPCVGMVTCTLTRGDYGVSTFSTNLACESIDSKTCPSATKCLLEQNDQYPVIKASVEKYSKDSGINKDEVLKAIQAKGVK